MILRSRLLPRLLAARTRFVSNTTRSRTQKPTPVTKPKSSAAKAISHNVGNVVLAGVQTSLFIHFFCTYVAEISPCSGVSMIPTISLFGDWVVTNKWHRHGRGIKVGDVVYYIKPTDPTIEVIKRVIGMPGDFVVGGNYVEPGEEKTKSPLRLVRGEDDRGWEFLLDKEETGKMMLQVPEGHCWMVGDNMSESTDSRLYGPVPLALIKGKVVAKILPFSDAGWIRNNVEVVDDAD